jgi:hypothetical protein
MLKNNFLMFIIANRSAAIDPDLIPFPQIQRSRLTQLNNHVRTTAYTAAIRSLISSHSPKTVVCLGDGPLVPVTAVDFLNKPENGAQLISVCASESSRDMTKKILSLLTVEKGVRVSVDCSGKGILSVPDLVEQIREALGQNAKIEAGAKNGFFFSLSFCK